MKRTGFPRILLGLLVFLPAFLVAVPNLAVDAFRSTGKGDDALLDEIRTQVERAFESAPFVRLLDRTMTQRILKEKALQMSGVTATSEGQTNVDLLAADLLLEGVLTRASERTLISFRVVDAGTGAAVLSEVVASPHLTFSGDLRKGLRGLIDRLDLSLRASVSYEDAKAFFDRGEIELAKLAVDKVLGGGVGDERTRALGASITARYCQRRYRTATLLLDSKQYADAYAMAQELQILAPHDLWYRWLGDRARNLMSSEESTSAENAVALYNRINVERLNRLFWWKAARQGQLLAYEAEMKELAFQRSLPLGGLRLGLASTPAWPFSMAGYVGTMSSPFNFTAYAVFSGTNAANGLFTLGIQGVAVTALRSVSPTFVTGPFYARAVAWMCPGTGVALKWGRFLALLELDAMAGLRYQKEGGALDGLFLAGTPLIGFGGMAEVQFRVFKTVGPFASLRLNVLKDASAPASSLAADVSFAFGLNL